MEQTKRVQKIAEQHHGSDFQYADTEEAKVDLWKVIADVRRYLDVLQELRSTCVCIMSKIADDMNNARGLWC